MRYDALREASEVKEYHGYNTYVRPLYSVLLESIIRERDGEWHKLDPLPVTDQQCLIPAVAPPFIVKTVRITVWGY